MDIYLLRHGSTVWNEEKKYLGSSDIPLSEKGANEVKKWRLPADAAQMRLISSSLLRAKQTMEILFPGQPFEVDDRLREMNLGSWEGKTREEVKPLMSEKARGLDYHGMDFREHGGESLQQVQDRVKGWLEDLKKSGAKKVLAVSHRATITSFYALATDWKVESRPEQRILSSRLHSFVIDQNGKFKVNEINIPLENPGA